MTVFLQFVKRKKLSRLSFRFTAINFSLVALNLHEKNNVIRAYINDVILRLSRRLSVPVIRQLTPQSKTIIFFQRLCPALDRVRAIRHPWREIIISLPCFSPSACSGLKSSSPFCSRNNVATSLTLDRTRRYLLSLFCFPDVSLWMLTARLSRRSQSSSGANYAPVITLACTVRLRK